MKRILLLPSASRKPITVWPHRPKITSTPEALEVVGQQVRRDPRLGLGAARLTAAWAAMVIMVGFRLRRDRRVVELAEQLGFRRLVLGDRPADPRHVHVVLERDVLVGDVAAPDAAAHARGHRHAVGEGAGVGARLDLPHHDAADRRHQREPVDVLVVERVDAARVAAAAGLEDLPHLVERVVEAVNLNTTSTTPSFSVENGCCLPMCVSSTMKKRLAGGKGDAGLGGDRRGGSGDGVGGAPALLVPVGLLQLLLLLGVDEVAAFAAAAAAGSAS